MVLRGRSLLCFPTSNSRLVITHARVTEALFGRGVAVHLLCSVAHLRCRVFLCGSV